MPDQCSSFRVIAERRPIRFDIRENLNPLVLMVSRWFIDVMVEFTKSRCKSQVLRVVDRLIAEDQNEVLKESALDNFELSVAEWLPKINATDLGT